MGNALQDGTINKKDITDSSDLALLEKSNLTASELDSLLKKYGNTSIEKYVTYDSGLIGYPSLDIENSTLELDINGYL